MPPNTMDSSLNIESMSDMSKSANIEPVELSRTRYYLLMSQATLNVIGYILIGIVVCANLMFAYRFGTNLSTVNLHIVLCVLGYQLLMAVGMMSLASESGATRATLQHKRWIHGFLQVVGAVLSIYGSIVMSLWKNINWNTLHGQFALVALVFLTVCLFNGVASLFAYEWRKCIPPNISKLSHILFGIVSFSTAAISLCYGFEKLSFRNWATNHFTVVLYVFTGIYTAIFILNPFITFFTKISKVCKTE